MIIFYVMMIRKVFLFVLIICVFAFEANCQTLSAFTHEVKPGETLYSISSRYGVTVDALKTSNGLSSDAVVAGQILRVVKTISMQDDNATSGRPDCRLMYKVQKKETVYSICKKFDLTEDEFYAANPILLEKKLKKKQLVCIPYKKVEQPVLEEVVVEELAEPMKIALMLPFGLGKDKVGATNLKMLDFYEGFLLALEAAKSLGLSAEVYVFDEVKADSTGVLAVLGNGRLEGVDLLVGPYAVNHLEQFIPFAKKNDIKMLVPFTSKSDYTLHNHNVFQLNVPQASFYSKVYEHFFSGNAEKNIVFLLANDRTDNTLYFEGFKKSALERGVHYKIVDMNALDEFSESMSYERENVIIPLSPSEKVFNRIVKTLDKMERTDSVNISMFGQSNWQQFMGKYKGAFQKYDCTFFSKFLYDPLNEKVSLFQSNFKHRFGREQYMSYPMYGVMGYDLGIYFLNAYNQFGEDFADYLYEYESSFLQTPLYFERKNEDGGFSNNKVMFVKVGANGAIEKKIF